MAIRRCAHQAFGIRKNLSIQKIIDEATYLKTQQTYLQTIPQEELTQLLHDVLTRKLKLSIERLLLFIALYYSDKPIMAVKMGLELGKADELSYALELLERSVNSEHKEAIMPILNSIYLSDLDPQGCRDSVDFEVTIRQNLHLHDREHLTILSCLACLYIIKTLGKQAFLKELNQLKQSHSKIIQETLNWLDEQDA